MSAFVCAVKAGANAQTTLNVRAGAPLETIGTRYGVSPGSIASANALSHPELLRVGRTLKIPGSERSSSKQHVVAPGDTVGGIAHEYGISAKALLDANRLEDPDRLRIGQTLVIPADTLRRAVRRPALPPALKSELDRIPVRRNRWRYIVIHHSATDTGTPQSLDQYHRRRGMENGLAYHFVIGNGRGMADGQIAVGHRWRAQLKGGHLASDALNEVAIGICLIGNFEKNRPTAEQMRSLYALTGYLMNRTGLGIASVRTHRQINPKPTICPGRHFPVRAMLENLQ